MADLFIVQRISPPSAPRLLKGPNNRQLTDAEVRGLATLYWPIAELSHCVEIARCESGHWTGAWAYENEDSRGLYQLNVEAHSELLYYDLFDPQINSYWAFQLWSKQGWQPWTCAKILGIV